MAFSNPATGEIEQLLRKARTIAVVGLSADPLRPSHRVARALQGFGYRIIPVNPGLESVLGERSAPDLESAQRLLRPGEQIDIVDVFRRPEFVAGIVDDCIRLQLPALWLQEGVIDERAALRARAAGLFVVMNRCLYRDRARMVD
jgi:predicted CoA-binding protein